MQEDFNQRITGVVFQRNAENHNICEEVIGHYEYLYSGDGKHHQETLAQLIEDLQARLVSYEAAGIK